jgi:hypothetical protein
MQTIDPQSLMKRGLDALVKQAKGGKITAPRSRDYAPAPAKKAERPCFVTHGYKRPKVSRERI